MFVVYLQREEKKKLINDEHIYIYIYILGAVGLVYYSVYEIYPFCKSNQIYQIMVISFYLSKLNSKH